MKGWTDVPLDRPVATIMLLVCGMVLGTVALFYMPIDFMPNVAEPEIDIVVPYPGSHPLESLREIVRPIEEEVAAIPDVKHIFGYANQANGYVEVQFDWKANIELKKMEVREAVERARAQLPESVGHIRVEGDTDGPGSEVLNGRISAQRDLSESWDLLDRRIRQPLERIRGVARVDLYGVEPQQVRVDIDLAGLRQHGISVEQLMQRINAANLDLDLGVVRGDALAYDVRAHARIDDVETIRSLPLSVEGVHVRDVADVRLREPILDYGRHLNRNFAIGFDVHKEPSANTVATVRALTDRIEQIRHDPQLQGIQVLVWDNAAEAILLSLEGLRNAGIFGGFLAVFVLFFFLRRVTTTLIVAAAIPFSLLVTCGAMFLIGKNFNVLTMLGLMLGVGMLVDNGVVVIENIYRLQGQGKAPRDAARLGARQVALAVFAATLTTIIVWSWLFVSEPDTMTIYIGEVATVVCLSVACSLVISLTFIPLAASRFVPAKAIRAGFMIRRVVPAYRRLLGWTLRHRVVALLALFALAASAAIPIYFIEKTGEPKFQQRDVGIHYEIHDPATKETAEAYVNQVEDWLESRRDELGYEAIYSFYGVEWGAGTRVYLPREATTEGALKRLRRQLGEGLPIIPGVALEVGGDRRGRHRSGGEKGSVRVAFHGEDPEYLERVASSAEAMLGELPDVREVFGPSLVGQQEIRVIIDPERARALGVSPRRVADAVGFTFRGQRLRRFQGPRGEIEILLGIAESVQPGLDSLTTILVPTIDESRMIELGALAEIATARTPPGIRRLDRRTTQWVTVEFDEDATTTQAARELVAKKLDALDLPDGYSWNWGQRMRDDDDALAIMTRGILLSLLVVMLLMAALFESFTQPLAILVTLPLALFGAFWSLWLFGFEFEVLGFIGVIILIGVVVNNGIVMVDHVNSLRGHGKSRTDALIEGCGDRLRPVLMTVITTVVGLIPLAVSEFTVAGVYIQSLAVAMIGGLVSSTVFTLVALPVWYTAIEDLGAVLAGVLPSRGSGSSAAARPVATMATRGDAQA